MPKLTQIKGAYADDAGKQIGYSADVSVDSEGYFAIEIPEKDANEYGLILQKNKNNYKGLSVGIKVVRKIRKYFITGKDFELCKSFFLFAVKQANKYDIKEELVILYRFRKKISYIKNTETGEVSLPDKNINYYVDNQNGKIQKISNITERYSHKNEPVYSVGLSAGVFLKKTLTRENTKDIFYFLADEQLKKDSFGDVLNRISVGYDAKHYSYREYGIELTDDMVEIPYAENSAEFFYNMVIGLCKLSDKLTDFMSKDNILKTIENNNFKLLTGE
jgi:hypothetical protein